MTSMTPADFFSGGSGPPSFKFTNPGDRVTGKITEMKVVQQRTYSPTGVGELKTWPSGDPMMQLNITLQTILRDPAVDDDDGQRRVYVDGKRIRQAVTDAFAKAGEEGLSIGGTYTQTFTGYDPDSKNPANPAKVYEVVYAPPNAAGEFFNGGAAPQPAAAAPTSAPTPPPSAAPNDALLAALGNLSPEAKAAILAQVGK
jgi:hypothetical protein